MIIKRKLFGYSDEFVSNLNLDPSIISEIITNISSKNYIFLITNIGKILLPGLISLKRYNDRLAESNITNKEFDKCKKELPPEYNKLYKLKSLIEKEISSDEEFTNDFKRLYNSSFIPGYMDLLSVEKITEYRKDSIKNGKDDYSEILFMFGGKLVFGFNFSKKYWFIRCNTRNMSKSWKIKEGDFWNAVSYTFTTFDKNKLKYNFSEDTEKDLDYYIQLLIQETNKLKLHK